MSLRYLMKNHNVVRRQSNSIRIESLREVRFLIFIIYMNFINYNKNCNKIIIINKLQIVFLPFKGLCKMHGDRYYRNKSRKVGIISVLRYKGKDFSLFSTYFSRKSSVPRGVTEKKVAFPVRPLHDAQLYQTTIAVPQGTQNVYMHRRAFKGWEKKEGVVGCSTKVVKVEEP